MTKYLNQIKALKKINKSTIINSKFLINAENNIKIYYAPFDYVNPKAKLMIVGITPGFQQMLQSFEVINEGKSLKEVKDLSSFKGSMRTTLVKYLDELKVNKTIKIITPLLINSFTERVYIFGKINLWFINMKKTYKRNSKYKICILER